MNGCAANDNDDHDACGPPDLYMMTIDSAVELLTREAEDDEQLTFLASRLIAQGLCLLASPRCYGQAAAVKWVRDLADSAAGANAFRPHGGLDG